MKWLIETVKTYHSHSEYIIEASSEEEAIDKWSNYDFEQEDIGAHGLVDMDDEEFQSCSVVPDNRSYEAQVNDFVSKVIDGVEV